MYVVQNIDDETIFKGKEKDLISFIKKIVIENGDLEYSVLGISDALEYISNYCDNLKYQFLSNESCDELHEDEIEEATCPLREELDNDYETLCNCNDEERYECGSDL